MLRFQDYRCISCNREFEKLVTDGELAYCCGYEALKMPMAPAVHFKMGRRLDATGGKYETLRQLDRDLEKNNQWMPDEARVREYKEQVLAGEALTPVGTGHDKAKIERAVRVAMDKAHSDGVYSDSD